jgi:RHS repeat-associated protein
VIVPKGGIHGGYTTANSVLLLDDYCGSYLYENGTSASVHPLTKILTPEGYVDMSTSGYPYCYYKQDHLGSNREVTSYTGTTGTVVQQTEYYPSGTAYVEGTGAGIQPFKFTGKELIIMHGLNWQDFGARWLDNVRMQWTTMDPLAEKYYSVSPYVYCAGNPVKYLDPSGGRLVDANGNLMYTQIGGWTKYATEDVKRIGNDMMRTETGNKQWNKMANVSYSITPKLSSEDKTVDKGNGIKERTFGVTNAVDVTKDGNGIISIKKMDLIVYEGTIKTYLKDHPDQTITMDEKIASVGGHESVHATDKENIKQNVANTIAGKAIYDTEAIPNQVEKQIEDEIQRRRPPVLLPIPKAVISQ